MTGAGRGQRRCQASPRHGSQSRAVPQLTGFDRVAVGEGNVTRQGHRFAEVSDGEGECTGLHAVAQVGG